MASMTSIDVQRMARECCGGRHSKTASDSHRMYIPSEDIGDYEEFTSGNPGKPKRYFPN
jgi:hypothetical protein